MMPPLQLPKVTFLQGSDPDSRARLATAIAMLDRQMLIEDLESPLRLATHALFFGGFTIDHDLTIHTERIAPPSGFGPLAPTIGVWLTELRTLICDTYGLSAIGQVSLNDLRDTLGISFDRVIYRDLLTDHDAAPFIREYGASQVCIVHLDVMRVWDSPCWHIWIPVSGPDLQLDYLRNELDTGARRHDDQDRVTPLYR